MTVNRTAVCDQQAAPTPQVNHFAPRLPDTRTRDTISVTKEWYASSSMVWPAPHWVFLVLPRVTDAAPEFSNSFRRRCKPGGKRTGVVKKHRSKQYVRKQDGLITHRSLSRLVPIWQPQGRWLGIPCGGNALTMSRCMFPEYLPLFPMVDTLSKVGSTAVFPFFPASFAAFTSFIA